MRCIGSPVACTAMMGACAALDTTANQISELLAAGLQAASIRKTLRRRVYANDQYGVMRPHRCSRMPQQADGAASLANASNRSTRESRGTMAVNSGKGALGSTAPSGWIDLRSHF